MNDLQRQQMIENKDRGLFIDPERPGVVVFDDDPLGGMLGGAFASRVVACVNACRGMEDPEAEIAALKSK